MKSEPATPTRAPDMGGDIHTHAHAQDSLQNVFVQGMGTAGSL